ncbi:hypothetical protein [Agarivorans gilvus]|uniref:Uncharacterized protein n=1 Tax=Agarivorans gilvus TaxID=680279 RepID=A0ABQ1I482_9ALTE|nr:hypothetical protein [Agarivorans gilvus]GGB10747.1 hypothetical protein GCM10007414_25190 [Agarivorans gilvus]
MKKFLLSFVLIAFSGHSFAAKPIPDDVLVQIDKTTFFNFLNERVQHEVKTNVSLKEFRKSTEAFKVEFNKKTNKDAFFWYSADRRCFLNQIELTQQSRI